MKRLVILLVLSFSAVLVAASPFRLAPGATWPPAGVMTAARANNVAYAEAFAVKVELMMSVTGQNFYDLIRDAQSTACIGLPPTTSWVGARSELSDTWLYGRMLDGYYSGEYPYVDANKRDPDAAPKVGLGFHAQSGSDAWIDLYRVLTFVDAAQTWAMKDKGCEDFNPIYRGMNGPQAGVTSLALGWAAERIVVGLPPTDRKWVGWLLVAVRVFDVVYNADHGVTLWSVRF